MNPAEKIWWTKMVTSLCVAGLTLAAQVFLDLSGITSFMLGVIIYFGLSYVLSNLMGVDRSRSLRIGVGVYFFNWMMAWILLYTTFGSPA